MAGIANLPTLDNNYLGKDVICFRTPLMHRISKLATVSKRMDEQPLGRCTDGQATLKDNLVDSARQRVAAQIGRHKDSIGSAVPFISPCFQVYPRDNVPTGTVFKEFNKELAAGQSIINFCSYCSRFVQLMCRWYTNSQKEDFL